MSAFTHCSCSMKIDKRQLFAAIQVSRLPNGLLLEMKEVERQSARPDPRHFLNVDVETCTSANPNYQSAARFTVQFQLIVEFLIENQEERGQNVMTIKPIIFRI